ncbi:MAG: hypothetical protein B7Z73_08040 [Planctomycetia bacterium 21-64-5]|nr:MAG: hypothetical protein B7Z73_08040 [Planctomycetia bacterium 21-64-5]
MRRVIELPDEIERALETRASAIGHDVPFLIELAVAAFVRNARKRRRRAASRIRPWTERKPLRPATCRGRPLA